MASRKIGSATCCSIPHVYLSHFDPADVAAIRADGVFQHYLNRIESDEPELRTSIYFDPAWYLNRYPEVARAIEARRGNARCIITCATIRRPRSIRWRAFRSPGTSGATPACGRSSRHAASATDTCTSCGSARRNCGRRPPRSILPGMPRSRRCDRIWSKGARPDAYTHWLTIGVRRRAAFGKTRNRKSHRCPGEAPVPSDRQRVAADRRPLRLPFRMPRTNQSQRRDGGARRLRRHDGHHRLASVQHGIGHRTDHRRLRVRGRNPLDRPVRSGGEDSPLRKRHRLVAGRGRRGGSSPAIRACCSFRQRANRTGIGGSRTSPVWQPMCRSAPSAG